MRFKRKKIRETPTGDAQPREAMTAHEEFIDRSKSLVGQGAAPRSEAGRFAFLMSLLGLDLTVFLLPIGCSLVSALFEGATMGLLIPMLKFLVENTAPENGIISVLGYFKFQVPPLADGSRNWTMLYLCSLLFGVAAIKVVSEAAGNVALDRVLQRFMLSLRSALFDRFLIFGKGYYDQHQMGKVWGILINYTSEVGSTLPHGRTILTSALFMATYFGILMTISWKLTLIALFCVPILALSVKRLIDRISQTARARAGSLADLSHNVADIVASMPLIAGYSTEVEESARFRATSEKVSRSEFSISARHNVVLAMQEMLTLGVVVLLVVVASFIGSRDVLGPGTQYLVFFLIVRRFVNCFTAITGARMAFTKLNGLLDEIFSALDNEGKHYVVGGKRVFLGLKDCIELKNLTFSYQKGSQVLKDISTTFNKGEMTAIVGPSGSGKSTLIQLLQRNYEVDPGQILVDGVDAKEYSLQSLRARVSVVSQETLLFNASVRQNLTYGLNREIQEDELMSVLKKASLEEFVQALPSGLDTLVGDRGVRLSGGERQRVSIARAMLKKAEILLLDEATSALDTATERLIQDAISKLVRNRTVIVIAHRLSTVMDADKIVVLENGRLLEQGSVKTLLARRGRFYEFYQAQNFASEPERKAG